MTASFPPMQKIAAERAFLQSPIRRLSDLAKQKDASGMAQALELLDQWIGDDLAEVEAGLSAISGPESLVAKSARHLLDLKGKYLRPMCVLLAAKLGREVMSSQAAPTSSSDVTAASRALAIAVELVHSATLLHDDVVDVSEQRRGTPTARVVYGNAAAIFAGDWLLVDALRRIRSVDRGDLLGLMLSTIEEMIFAESIQLEHRGVINSSVTDYFAVVEGKTASLFRWAMRAGGIASGMPSERCDALAGYGHELGVAFQAQDDLLDLAGNTMVTGKALFSDLREGKMTYPLLLAMEKDDSLAPILTDGLARDDFSAATIDRVLTSLSRTGALEACQELAERRTQAAISALDVYPNGPAKTALVAVAQTALSRQK